MGTVQVVSGILLVFGLLALFYRLANRLNGGKGFRPGNARIQIVEARSIGDKRALLLVRIGDEQFLLGATSSQISMLAPIPEPTEEFASDDESEPSPDSAPRSFRGFLEMLR